MNGLFLWFVTHHKRNKNKIDRQGAQIKELFLRHPTILVVYPVIRMINPVFWIQDSKINP